jgi:type 1 fimbriae regulatory protein FimB/type 1 fimbriae regulatory protein FimE
MPKPILRIVSPDTVKWKVTPRRPKNADVRTREYLTEREVERLIEGCKGNRRPHRDQTMILMAFRHGLRASEVCDLQWTQVDFEAATLAVTRAKHGTPSTHPLTGRELRALRRLHREAEGRSPFLFVSERGSPMTISNFQKLISRACEAAGLKIKAHPHCSGTPAASIRQTRGGIPDRCRLTSVTRTSSTRFDMPSWRRRGSRAGGKTDMRSLAEFASLSHRGAAKALNARGYPRARPAKLGPQCR